MSSYEESLQVDSGCSLQIVSSLPALVRLAARSSLKHRLQTTLSELIDNVVRSNQAASMVAGIVRAISSPVRQFSALSLTFLAFICDFHQSL